MSQKNKLLAKISIGDSDGNIPFEPLCQLLESLGFELRIRSSHHIFTREDVLEILNLQPQNGKAKKYQVRQIRSVILQYHLGE
jgi:predicted RNA binding protein YcfA (HicA-like mRNA interferase family)